ncbi:MAG: alkaline phosphatase family protein [Acidobacteria bacterium]|nr:alkaline phosphatase family protein [Acidobacteriota bacterium]
MTRLLALCTAAALVSAQPKPVTPGKPKLLLVITVDQFRYDYLTRFRAEYNSGLHRLLTQGANFTNTNYEQFPTKTAIGHSTITTGASPIVSGIVSNDWYDRDTGAIVTSVSDKSRKLLGADTDASSPHRLLVSTIADEIKMSGKGESKAIGISVKDRSAILPVGRMADAAYWFSNEAGTFVSSTWYMNELPAWVANHNAKRPGERYLRKPWIPRSGGEPFKTMLSKPDTMFYSNLEKTPFGNELLEEFALLAIDNEKLGQHTGVDVLALSLSCNDYVGHAHGPDSPEVRDISVHTDRLLGRLFAHLEKRVGMRNVVVVLSADHGVAPNPELNKARKMPGERFKDADWQKVVNDALKRRYGGDKWVVGKTVDQLYLDPKQVAKNDPAEVRHTAAEAIRNLPHVVRVYTREQILRGETGQDKFGRRVHNGYHATRGPDAVVINEPYVVFGTDKATHSTVYSYDTHVPLLIMGPGIKAGRYHQAAAVNDIAPTLATLLEVEVPAGSMGRVLHEALIQ